ncbi:MAG: hypothetical protein GWP17_01410 [Aquificales bacterium]|nr:hypothetical protein [Aquificales bacterium]
MNISEAEKIFSDTLIWLENNYGQFRFWMERDLVWTVQNRLIHAIQDRNLSYKVFNDYPMFPSENRREFADLVILDADNQVQIAIEFKYEPSHQRDDILPSKFPVVPWGKDGGRHGENGSRLGKALPCRPWGCGR